MAAQPPKRRLAKPDAAPYAGAVTAASLPKRLLADLALLAVATLWGATFPLAKEILRHLSPFQYLGVRFALAALLLGLLAAPQLRRADAGAWRGGLLVGLALAAGYGFQTLGLRTAAATVAAFLTGLSVVLVPVLGLAWGRRPTQLEWLGVAAGLCGMALLTYRGGFHMGAGEILLLGCAVAFAFHIVLLDRHAYRTSPLALGAMQLAVVALLCGGLSAGEPPPSAVPSAVWLAVAAMAVLASALAFSVQSWAQRFTPPTHVGLIFAFEPVAAALFAWWWLSERLAAAQWVGAGLVLAGIVLSEIKPPARPMRYPETRPCEPR